MENLNEIKEALKDMFRVTINNDKDSEKDGEKGRWVTIKGTHVFIPDGKQIEDVMREKGWEEKGEGKKEEPYKWNRNEIEREGAPIEKHYSSKESYENAVYKWAIPKGSNGENIEPPEPEYSYSLMDLNTKVDKWLHTQNPSNAQLQIRKEYLKKLDEESGYKNYAVFYEETDKKVKNALSEIIQNCKPETKQDLEILKGLEDILNKQD